MIRPAPPKARGAAGVLFVVFLGVVTAGVLVSAIVLSDARAGPLAGPGGRAVLGASVAIGAALLTLALRLALGRPAGEEGGRGVRVQS